jgi:hypothetical protein
MRDTAEAISRGTDMPVDRIGSSLEDLMRHGGLTLDEACLELHVTYGATFHALAHRAIVVMGELVPALERRTPRSCVARMTR